jgi:hypothetical protein
VLPDIFWPTLITSATFSQDITPTDRIAALICESLTDFTPLIPAPRSEPSFWLLPFNIANIHGEFLRQHSGVNRIAAMLLTPGPAREKP